MTEDKTAERHHQLNGHEFKQTLEDGEGQGSLVCYCPRGRKESDMAEQLNNNNIQQEQLNVSLKKKKKNPTSSFFPITSI